MTRRKTKELLVDGDIVLHRFGHANQVSSIEWEEGVESETVALEPEAAIADVQQFFNGLTERLRPEAITVVFSGPRNFRYGVLPSYKWNRKQVARPILLGAIKEWVQQNFVWLEQPVLEGDDLMGIISTTERGKYIIVSIDKDLLQIPGAHYNWLTGRKTTVTKDAGDHFFYRQVLTGDPGDGYTGIPGIGPVKAEKILSTEINENPDDPMTSPWERIVAAYTKAGLTEADALVQARVARILRKGEYDFAKGEVKLWTPS